MKLYRCFVWPLIYLNFFRPNMKKKVISGYLSRLSKMTFSCIHMIFSPSQDSKKEKKNFHLIFQKKSIQVKWRRKLEAYFLLNAYFNTCLMTVTNNFFAGGHSCVVWIETVFESDLSYSTSLIDFLTNEALICPYKSIFNNFYEVWHVNV